jgi:hypothetical protein
MEIPNQLLTTMLADEIILFSTEPPKKRSLILTNKRAIIYALKPGLLSGPSKSLKGLAEWTWSDLKGISFDGIAIKFNVGGNVILDYCPDERVDDIKKIFAIIREMKDKSLR